MPAAHVIRFTHLMLTDLKLLATIVAPESGGLLIVQADVTTLAIKVTDTKTGTVTYSQPAETVADLILDTPGQNADDESWPADQTDGYNFRKILPGTAFPLPNVHVIDVDFTGPLGEKWAIVYETTDLKRYN